MDKLYASKHSVDACVHMVLPSHTCTCIPIERPSHAHTCCMLMLVHAHSYHTLTLVHAHSRTYLLHAKTLLQSLKAWRSEINYDSALQENNIRYKCASDD